MQQTKSKKKFQQQNHQTNKRTKDNKEIVSVLIDIEFRNAVSFILFHLDKIQRNWRLNRREFFTRIAIKIFNCYFYLRSFVHWVKLKPNSASSVLSVFNSVLCDGQCGERLSTNENNKTKGVLGYETEERKNYLLLLNLYIRALITRPFEMLCSPKIKRISIRLQYFNTKALDSFILSIL